jgi:hypothetical protein
MAHIAKADAFEPMIHRLRHFRLRRFDKPQWIGQIFINRSPQDDWRLKDKGVLRRIIVLPRYRSAGDPFDPMHNTQQRRLARPVWPDNDRGAIGLKHKVGRTYNSFATPTHQNLIKG